MIRVLQTLALPLGHVAIKIWLTANGSPCMTSSHLPSAIFWKRAGNETRTRDLLHGKQTFYQLNYARVLVLSPDNAERQNRTGDTAIFSRVLYQLS